MTAGKGSDSGQEINAWGHTPDKKKFYGGSKMNQSNLSEVRFRMDRALALIKEAVDISLPLLGNEQREEIIALWEDFLREFFSYIKKRGRETRRNLFSCISFRRIWVK